jgi:hypothetical protein
VPAVGNDEKGLASFNPSQPREKWIKKRTSVKLKVHLTNTGKEIAIFFFFFLLILLSGMRPGGLLWSHISILSLHWMSDCAILIVNGKAVISNSRE